MVAEEEEAVPLAAAAQEAGVVPPVEEESVRARVALPERVEVAPPELVLAPAAHRMVSLT